MLLFLFACSRDFCLRAVIVNGSGCTVSSSHVKPKLTLNCGRERQEALRCLFYAWYHTSWG
jgi:hypothetical protein